MRVGLMIPPQTPLAAVVPLARRAESLGYDFLGCGEHVFFHAPMPNAFVALAAAAGATERIRLLSAVTVLPVYPAALAAKMAATLDGVSGGRFELGIGIGGEHPAELLACGVDPSTRGAYTDEALAVMVALFAGEQVSHEGAFITIDGQRLDPAPVQRPRMPLWVGGRQERAMRRAGRFADVWMPYMVDPAGLATSLARAREHATEAGRPADAVSGAYFAWANIDRDGARARRVGLEVLRGVYNQDMTSRADRYIPLGTPEHVAARLTEYAAAGAESIVFSPACPDAETDQVVERFAREVAPALRAAAAAGATAAAGVAR